ncbi:MAG: hypothetical protein FWF46_00775 [Oscillospiraceae bacterium]|nr:hypothetical protein [Oscillospiraceae bacterium]
MKNIIKNFFKRQKNNLQNLFKKSKNNSKDFFVVMDKLTKMKIKNEQIYMLLWFSEFLKEVDIATNKEEVDNIINKEKQHINSLILEIMKI